MIDETVADSVAAVAMDTTTTTSSTKGEDGVKTVSRKTYRT